MPADQTREAVGLIDMQISTFRIDHEYFGVPTLLVEELFRPLPLTRVPSADPRIEGVVNIRGTTAVVISMRRCLGRQDLDESIRGEMILLETAGGLVEEARQLGLSAFDEPVVLSVDESTQIHQLPIDKNYPPPAHITQPFVEGVARAGDIYVTIISVKKLIADIQKGRTEV
jgi:chemotaxis signal transduction protein